MLWKSVNTTKSQNPTEEHEARQAQALWHLVHEGNGQTLDGAQAEHDATDRELAELIEVSQAVRESLGDATLEATREIDAREAFAPIHTRLMEAIAVSRDAAEAPTSIATASIAPVRDDADFKATPISNPNAARGALARDAAWLKGSWKRLVDMRRPETAKSFLKSRGLHLWPGRLRRPDSTLRWGLALLVAGAVGFGGQSVSRVRAARELPVQSLVDDFDAGLHSATPFEFVADDSQSERVASQRLSRQMGVSVRVPTARQAGVRLLGARRHPLWNRPGVKTHYVKNGVQVALYQIREPRCSLNDLDETEVGGRLYLTGARGNYRVVAWRAGDNVMTLISPLAMKDALDLARNLRTPETPAEIAS